MAYFVLGSRVSIGRYSFTGGIHEVTIQKSVKIPVDTAKLIIPGIGKVIDVKKTALAAAGLEVQGDIPNASVQVARLFKEGDPVSIDLGYNGDLRNEFRGFVRRVNIATPVMLELEGYAWQLRNQNIMAAWRKTTVREVLERIIQGTDIRLSEEIPDIALTNFYIRNENGLKVLDYLKEKMLLTCYFDDEVLYVGIEEGRSIKDRNGNTQLIGSATEKISIGYNVPSEQADLKQRLATDNKVKVRLKVCHKTGSQVLYEAGDPDGAIVERIIPHNGNENYLKDAANYYLKKLKYDGYSGSLNCFLQPYIKPGMAVNILDKRYGGARAGTYFVPSTEVKYGVRGGWRKVEVSYRLDDGD